MHKNLVKCCYVTLRLAGSPLVALCCCPCWNSRLVFSHLHATIASHICISLVWTALDSLIYSFSFMTLKKKHTSAFPILDEINNLE